MKTLIKQLFVKWTCSHDWKVHHDVELYYSEDTRPNRLPYGHRQTLICKKCGKIKKINL